MIQNKIRFLCKWMEISFELCLEKKKLHFAVWSSLFATCTCLVRMRSLVNPTGPYSDELAHLLVLYISDSNT